jgi:anti-anti-sigma factor
VPTCSCLGVRNDGTVVVVDFGNYAVLDIVTADRMGEDLYRVADDPGCQHMLLNFAGVTGLSSVMLGKLLVLRKKMQRKQGVLRLCAVSAEVHDVFAATKLNQLLEIHNSEADALKTFTTSGGQ